MSRNLLHSIVSAVHTGGHRLRLRFDDGVEVEVDLLRVIRKFNGLLTPLKDPAYVALVRVEPEPGTVIWPNGADLDEVVLYCAVLGIPVPSYREQAARHPKSGAAGRRKRPASRPAKRARKAGG